jgi:hypothetical protein
LATYDRLRGVGVGIALGPAAGVVDLEVDDRDAAAALLHRIAPAETIGWRSARGDHRLYRWDERLGRLTDKSVVYLEGGAVEVRLGAVGKQLVAVCPPTVGSDRRKRAWNGVWKIAPFPEQLLGEVEREQARKSRLRERPKPLSGALPDQYGAAALRAEAALVRSAPPGTRNRTLNRAAFNLGQLVAGGLIARSAIEEKLTAAAADVGLPDREIAATLRSGLEAGLKNPRKRSAPAG